MALRSSPQQQALTRVGRTGFHLRISLASETHGAAVDSNLVAALIIALGRAVRRLLRPARSGAKLMILLRLAERRFSGLFFQEPPCNTRRPPRGPFPGERR